jgi:hypothetical protein
MKMVTTDPAGSVVTASGGLTSGFLGEEKG